MAPLFSEDDAADFTGTWYLAGTTAPIAITEDRIQLTDDVSYRYAMLNDQDKTFELSFGNLKAAVATGSRSIAISWLWWMATSRRPTPWATISPGRCAR